MELNPFKIVLCVLILKLRHGFLSFIGWSSFRELVWSAAGRVLCAAAGVSSVAVCTAFMMLATTQMRYLSEQWAVVPFYWVPYLCASVATSHIFDRWRSGKTNLNRSIRTSQAMSATRLLLSSLLLVLCCLPSLSNVRYLITTPLLVMSVASVVTMSAVRYGRLKALQHLALEVLLNIPATMLTFSMASRFNSLLIPIMGRSSIDYPDGVIAAANAAIAVIAAATIFNGEPTRLLGKLRPQSGTELLFSRRRLWTVLGGVSVASLVIMLIPFNPYRDVNTTQRHYWFHTQITSYDTNLKPTERVSGVMITKLDVHNVQSALATIKNSNLYIRDGEIIEKHGHDTDKSGQNAKLYIRDSDMKIINEDCDKLLYCNMPMFRPRFEKIMINSLFVKMGPPAQFTHSLELVNRSCVEDTCSLSFVMNGPPHNSVTIWPRQNVNVTSWSFNSPLKKTTTSQERPVYTIIHSTATYTELFEPLEFTLNLTVPQSHQSSILLDVSHHAHKIHHPDDFTDAYKQLLEVMPDYFNIATFLSFRSNYVF